MLRDATPDDIGEIVAMLNEAFTVGATVHGDPEALSLANRYVLDPDGRVQATAVAIPMGQFFGGRQVPAAAIRAVAVGTDNRGSGVGRALVEALLRRLHRDGIALATLFPSVPGPYRRAGWEIAGEHRIYRAPVDVFPISTSAQATVQDWKLEDTVDVVACYEQFAKRNSGLLARPESWWNRLHPLVTDGPATFRRIVKEGGDVTGFVSYSKAAVSTDLPYNFDLLVHDLAWSTPAASCALLAHLARHRGLGVDVRWPGPPHDPWLSTMASAVPRVEFAYPWMLRVVNVSEALTRRGYPGWADGVLTLAVADSAIHSNHAVWEVRVKDARSEVVRLSREPAGSDAQLDIGAFSSLYSGWASTADLIRSGRLVIASDADADTLDSWFAGPPPWLPEMF